jgi:hypothetical protein
MVDEDRRPCRRAQDAGERDLAPDDRVDERRLAGARRAADYGEKGRVDRGEARDDVVVELVAQTRPRRPAALGPGEVEWKGDLGDSGPQVLDCPEQPGIARP